MNPGLDWGSGMPRSGWIPEPLVLILRSDRQTQSTIVVCVDAARSIEEKETIMGNNSPVRQELALFMIPAGLIVAVAIARLLLRLFLSGHGLRVRVQRFQGE